MKKHLAASFMCLTLLTAALAPQATFLSYADEGDVSGAGYILVSKNLLMDSDANVPDATFTFSVTAGEKAISESSAELSVYSGIGLGEGGDEVKLLINGEPTTEGEAVFCSGMSVYPSDISAGGTVTPSDSRKFAVYTLKLDFSAVAFEEPGIYRYILSESGSYTGIENDAVSGAEGVRTIDVCVVRDSDDKLVIDRINVYEGEISGTVDIGSGTPEGGGTDTSSQAKSDTGNSFSGAGQSPESGYGPDGGYAFESQGDGSVTEGSDIMDAVSGNVGGYVNVLSSGDLTLSNLVAGNQGRKDKYFRLTVSVKGLNDGDLITIGSDSGIDSSQEIDVSASQYDAQEIRQANGVDKSEIVSGPQLKASEDGAVTHSFYLRAGQDVTLLGIPVGAQVHITLDPEGYSAQFTSEGTISQDTDADDGLLSLSGVMSESGISITFTNTLEGSVPSGVALPMLPYIAGALAALFIGLVLVISRRKFSKDTVQDL